MSLQISFYMQNDIKYKWRRNTPPPSIHREHGYFNDLI